MKESGLTQNQPQPHYDHFVVFLDSINQATMTEQYKYETSLMASEKCDVSDAEYRSWGGDIWPPKRKHQNGELARLWRPESVQIVTARKCNIKHHRQSSCSPVSLSCHPIQLRYGEDAWKELSRWALVLPPNTVKIRGGSSSPQSSCAIQHK